MRKRFRVDMAGGHPLQSVIANRSRCAQAGVDIVLMDDVTLLGRVPPDTGKAVGLQLELDGDLLCRPGTRLLQPPCFSLDAEDLLNVMADFVCENIRLLELARRPDTLCH